MVDQRSIRKRSAKKLKREDGNQALTFGTLSAIKKLSVKYTKFMFIRTSVNNWKNKCRPEVIILSLKK